MKKLFTLMMVLMAMVTASAATYTVSGSAAILNGTASWDITTTDNDMTSTDGVNYTLTVSGINVEAGTYEFKIVEDHAWTNSWPASNFQLTISETAKYDIVYTFNTDTKTVNANYTKVGEFDGSTEKTYTVAGDEGLMGNNWKQDDANHDMTKGDDGIYRLVLTNVTLEAKTYAFKVTVNHDWGTSYPGSNATLTIAEAGTYDVTFTFNEETKAVAATVEKAPDALFDFQNNNGNWPVGEGANFADGNVTTLTSGNVTLTGVQGSSANPPRIMTNASRGICLWLYKNTSIVLSAPQGKAITKLVFTMQTGSFDLTPSTGAVAENVWTGNASEVTFGPNANSTRYVWAIAVTLADENDETVKPAAIDVEAANIAEFNAVEDGKNVKLTLSNAKVNGSKNGDYYIEDASGATVIKGLTLTAGTALNGYVIGKKSIDGSVDMDGVIVEHALTATDASTFEATATTLTGTVMTGAEAAAQANYGRLITLENVAISGGNNKTLTVDGIALPIKARDYMGVLPADYTWPEQASKITGVLVYYVTGWFLMPVSAEAIVAAGAQATEATFDFTSQTIRENIGTAMADVKGFIYNETFTAENVTLQITGGSAPARIYVDNNRGQNLVIYKEYATLTFNAPAGYAITKIEFTAAGTSNINNFTASAGAIEGMVWTGNAEGVRFAQGGTSYLANAIVTLAAKNETTTALPAIEYAECANIAAFNALEAGTYAKVTLTDAEVTGVSADGYSTVFIQDATGGCWIQFTSLNAVLKEKTKLNGTVYTVVRKTSGNVHMKEAEDTPKSEITATEISELTATEGTLAEINVAANLNKVVKITGATLVEAKKTKSTGEIQSETGTLTQGEATIDVNNGIATANQQLHKIAEWEDGAKFENVTIVAILVAKSATANQLLPITLTGEVVDGIQAVDADLNAADVKIFNLQGVRQNSLKKGVNIINGKKVVIK